MGMRINPDRILEKLKEYEYLERKSEELSWKINDLSDKLRKLIGYEKWMWGSIWNVLSWLESGGKLTLKNFLNFMERYTKEKWKEEIEEELEVGEIDEKEAEEMWKDVERAINGMKANITKNWDEIWKVVEAARKIYEAMKECEEKRREIFGVLPNDRITIESVVGMIHRCLKHALEEDFGKEEVPRR